MTELQIGKYQPTTMFGHDQQIAGLVRRMRYMIPGAAKAPDMVIWKAAQIATIHHLDPFTGDVQIYSYYKDPGDDPDKWIVNIGISAWRRAAQRQSRYKINYRDLTPEEMQALDYEWTPNDVGVECTLVRFDVAREAKELDYDYDPTTAVGIWRQNAHSVEYNGKTTWKADLIPKTETKLSVAQRRAEKKALKIAYSLDFPDEAPMGEWQVIEEMDQKVTKEEQIQQPPTREELNREEDGDLLWA